MAARLVNVDRETPMLLPPDLREWVPGDDLVHFVLEAVMAMRDLPLKVNTRGTGSAQFPPRTMLALLIYCYANGIFSSRRIERATYMLVTVRYLMANHHPDHDTICTFRRENKPAVQQAFVEVLKLAKAMGVLKVGTVSVDGTHIRASASKDRNVRYDRACELERELTQEVDKLLEQAEQADRDDDPSADGQRIPDPSEQPGEAGTQASGPESSPEQKQIDRLTKLRDRVRAARQHMEEQAKEQAQAQQPAYEAKLAARQEKPCGGSPPKPPRDTPEPQQQVNLTDSDSRLMRKSRRSSYEQTYNAQAAVDAQGSMLILSAHVSQCASDVNELIPAIKGVAPEVGKVTTVLADTGYAKAQTFKDLQNPDDPAQKVELYVAVGRDSNHDQRRFDFRPESARGKPPKEPSDPELLAMKAKLATEEGRQHYRQRKQTVEPVFGIIKSVLGFRQFLTRGFENVTHEWSLVALSYNIKRLAVLKAAQPAT